MHQFCTNPVFFAISAIITVLAEKKMSGSDILTFNIFVPTNIKALERVPELQAVEAVQQAPDC